MLTAYQRTRNDASLREVPNITQGGWVRLEEPTEEEIALVVKEFGLDLGLVKDALDPYEAPRFELHGGNAYIFIRYPYQENPAGTAPLLVVVTERAVLTIASGTPSFLERFASGGVKFSTTRTTKLVILFIAEISARYGASLTAIQRLVNRRKHRIEELTDADIIEFATHEGAVNAFLDALIPQGSVLAQLAQGKTVPISEEDRDILDAVALSTIQLIERGKTILKTMGNTREAYTAVSAYKLNRVIRRLTALTVLVTIPNVITGFYGMNVLLPGAGHAAAAWALLAAMLSAVALITVFFAKKGWF